MLATLWKFIKADPRLQRLLLAGLLVQLVIAYTATGSYHPDQHFQIIEFSSYQLGQPHGAAAVWEFYNPVRPSLQIYLFSGWHLLMNAVGITNPYIELTVLRILLSLLMFFVFSGITIYYLRRESKKVLYTALIILNFSCFLPYFKTLFSSEIVSALVFFAALTWYDYRKDRKAGWGFLILVGFLFSLAFYLRFQTGFFLLGFGIWMIWVARKTAHIVPMAVGFLSGVGLNTGLDYLFFHRFEFTPYLYYYINIIDKRAEGFGTSSFLRYIGVFIAVVAAPPLSLILFFFTVKAFFRNYRHVLFLSNMAFIVAHCLVGHKEERFVFPAVLIMPVWVAWGLPAFFTFYGGLKGWLRYLVRGISYFSIGLNLLVLVLLVFNPYAQSIHFTEQIDDRLEAKGNSTLYFLRRSPFETPSRSPYIFYQRHFTHTRFVRVNNFDSIGLLGPSPVYLTTTFDDLEGRKRAESLGFAPRFYSSDVLWAINEWLNKRGMQPINDIWVMYEK